VLYTSTRWQDFSRDDDKKKPLTLRWVTTVHDSGHSLRWLMEKRSILLTFTPISFPPSGLQVDQREPSVDGNNNTWGESYLNQRSIGVQ
jgi:hypothetical protein